MDVRQILKYKKEFDHWLVHGSDSVLTNVSLGWVPIAMESDWSMDAPVVINDKYVEFRKALAEGKTVQYTSSRGPQNPVWEAMRQIDYLNKGPRFYRIKPDELKFKVGDWVKCPEDGALFKVIEHKDGWFYNTQEEYYDASDLALWKPQPGEWCWFFDKDSRTAVVAQYKGIKETEVYTYYVSTFQIDEGLFLNCEPFIGTLPTHLKDK